MTSESRDWWNNLFRNCLPRTRQRSRSDPSPSSPTSNAHSTPLKPVSSQPKATTASRPEVVLSDDIHPIAETKGSAVPGNLEVALKGLQASLDVFPPLQLAVGGLLECMTNLKIAHQNRQAYEEILGNLANLANQLQRHVSESKPTYMPCSIDNVARCIGDQTRHIRELKDRSRARQFAMAEEDEQNVLRCYRQLEALFRQTQTDISLSIWDAVREQHVETRLQGLGPADDAYYNSALPDTLDKRQACTPNTRTKVLEDSKSWTRRGGVPKIYWMNGMAGTGKTTIAYSLCKLLKDDQQLAASFFCSRYSPTCRDVNKIVPTIAYQLARYSNPYRHALCRTLDSNPDVAKQDIETQFENLIVKPLGSVRAALPGDLVVVIDALDECSNESGTTQVLDLLFRHAGDLPIKVFVTSRPEPALVRKITSQELGSRSIVHLHDIEDSLVQADIRTYLDSALFSLKLPAEQIDLLTTRAGRLFIFAATVVRFISPQNDSVDHEERLAMMLRVASEPGTQTQGYKTLDKLYSNILAKTLEEAEENQGETDMRRRVLWTIICARETMNTAALAQLLYVSEKKVELAIKPLQSVLHWSTATGVVSTLHASFPDFLLDHSRSERFYCDHVKHSASLATCCFNIMQRSLRFNICGLESSYLLDKDVLQIQARVDKEILPGLFYGCRYWGDHLSVATTPSELLSALEDFLTNRLLFWMEVLSVKQCVEQGEGILSRVLAWLPSDATYLSAFTHDARNFVTTFAANRTSSSTPHIYISTLPFTSKGSHVRRTYWPKTRGLMRIEGPGMDARGHSALATWDAGGMVLSIALSSDGKRVVSGSYYSHTVSIWDLSSGARVIDPLMGHEDGVWSVAFSPDSSRVASGSEDRTVRLWDAQKGSLITGPLQGHTSTVRSLAFSVDGARLASGSDDSTIRMWDAYSGAQLDEPLKGHQGAVRSVVFSPNGKHLASSSVDQTIRVWDFQAGTTVDRPIEGHTGAVYSVAYSHDGLRLASGSEDCTVRVWNVSEGTLLVGPFQGHSNAVSSVAFSPDGTRVVSGSSDATIRVWETASGTLLAGPLDGHSSDIRSVLFTADGTRIISGSTDRTIRVWDARQGSTDATESSGHTGGIYSVAWSPHGTRAVSGSSDKTICVWDTHSGALVAGPFKGHTSEVRSVTFSPDGARIVSGSWDCTLRTWDASSGALLVGPIEGHTDSVQSVAFSPDGSQIASGSEDHTIRLWNSHTGASVGEPFEGHTETVASITFSPDGAHIVSGSYDDTARMWDASDGTTLWTSDAHTNDVNCVAFSPDGGRVVSGSDDCTILVLDARDGAVLHGPFTGHTERVWSVAFSPDGTRVVSGSEDQTVRVWDVASGAMVAGPLKGHTMIVYSVAFSLDGARIVSSSTDHTIRIWDVAAITQASATSCNDWSIESNGWLTDSNSQRLFWVPSDLRRRFGLLTPSNPIVINADCTTRIDDAILIGDRWHECYNASSVSVSD